MKKKQQQQKPKDKQLFCPPILIDDGVWWIRVGLEKRLAGVPSYFYVQLPPHHTLTPWQITGGNN